MTSELSGLGSPSLTRQRVADAALALVQLQGMDGLTMRALADRLGVKAASLYWHMRDRAELMELLADAVLAKVPSSPDRSGWRDAADIICRQVAATSAAVRDGGRIVLSTPGALERSPVHERLRQLFESAGLSSGEAHATATMLLAYVLSQAVGVSRPAISEPGRVASIAIDTGSRGVCLVAGTAMDTLIRVPHDPSASGPVVVEGETVVVRRLRGVGAARIELSPSHPWRIRVHGGTWNTSLNLGGLDVREVKLDGGAARVECWLPSPNGLVPINVSGGVARVSIHRPPSVAVVAKVSSGALRVRLDEFAIRAALLDAHWESDPAARSSDHYLLAISGGAMQVTLDQRSPEAIASPPLSTHPEPILPGQAVSLLLDGIAARTGSARHR